MDPVSTLMVRAALVWMVAGFLIGALMMVDALAPGSWRIWFAPTHGHMLFVGWFLQFAVGVAYWLLPRKRTDDKPLGYHQPIAVAAFITLNAGLGLRVIFEPIVRMGHQLPVHDAVMILSALAHVAAIGIFASQLWGRVIPRRVLRERATRDN